MAGEFFNYQIERLAAFFPDDMRYLRQPARDEMANWLEAKVARLPLAFQNAEAARFITELTEFTNFPGVAGMVEVWDRLHPPPPRAEARPDCIHCGGSGFMVVQRGGADGAERCICGGKPQSHDPNELRKPIVLLSEIAKLRADNQQFAAELARDLQAKFQKRPPSFDLKKVEQEIEQLRIEQERRRQERLVEA